jgi:hypothetical protein
VLDPCVDGDGIREARTTRRAGRGRTYERDRVSDHLDPALALARIQGATTLEGVMRRSLFIVLAFVMLSAGRARAADHADGPSATQSLMDLSGDITDVYAFTDASNVNLIMDVGTNSTSSSKFSNVTQYVFHVNGVTGLSDMSPFSTDIICTFDASQKVSCWVQQGGKTVDYINGDASPTAGLTASSSKLKVFAGVRNDPFFFNIQGFRKVTGFVGQNLNALMPILSKSGCPQLDSAGSPVSSSAVRTLLKSQSDGTTPGVDDFAKGGTAAAPFGIATLSGNVLSLVVAIPKTTLNNNGAKPILGVWASTHK